MLPGIPKTQTFDLPQSIKDRMQRKADKADLDIYPYSPTAEERALIATLPEVQIFWRYKAGIAEFATAVHAEMPGVRYLVGVTNRGERYLCDRDAYDYPRYMLRLNWESSVRYYLSVSTSDECGDGGNTVGLYTNINKSTDDSARFGDVITCLIKRGFLVSIQPDGNAPQAHDIEVAKIVDTLRGYNIWSSLHTGNACN